MRFEVSKLHEAISALADVDPDGLTDAELHDLAVAVERDRARLGAAATLLARWDRRRG